MEFTLSNTTAHSVSCRLRPRAHQCANFIRSYDFPKQFGNGSIKQLAIQQGIDLFIAKYSVSRPLHIQVNAGSPAFELGFCLSGKGTTDIPGATVKTGCCHIMYRHRQDISIIDMAESYRLSVAIVVAPKKFHEITRHENLHLPPLLHLVAQGLTNKEYLNSIPIDSTASEILHQILTPKRTLTTSHMFYRSKVYEILAIFLNQLENETDREKVPPGNINPERVYRAAEILIHSMENPPSLAALSKMLSTSHVTLNQEFRQIFGTTVFGYLRQIRLNRARDLLEYGDTNVTETSLAVGYNSLSTFSRAFFDQHGITPSTCLKRSHQPSGQYATQT